MNIEDALREIMVRLDAITSIAIVWAVAPAVLLLALVFVLIMQTRAAARKERASDTLKAAVERLHSKLDMALDAKMQHQKQALDAHFMPPQEPAYSDKDLVAVINELLASQQPYNFIESIRAIDPRVLLERVTPCTESEPFAQVQLLESGGDSLFAHCVGDTAMLYPNYSRFSKTLDPKPLFDGAIHGGRIHSLLRPAVLTRTEDGRWRLSEKGRVHMRQGGENIR